MMKTTIQPSASLVLVVDDDLFLLAAISQTLSLNGYQVQTCSNPLEALQRIEEQTFGAVLADIRMPEMNGITLLENIVQKDKDLPVILITGHGDISLAVEAMKKGAYHFLQKPVDEDLIIATLERAIERRQLVLENLHLEKKLQVSNANRTRFYGLVGNHPAMHELYTIIETFAVESDPVLIIGETGTGKELVARALHEINQQDKAPYVAVNMGAIPVEMIESELFGYEKGAFTGAVQRKIGRFEFAGGGTIFLDEVCSMPAQLQSKLLRVLEERSFCRLGSNELIPMTARVVAATNKNLEQEVAKERFRQDLFFRLNVLPIHLPPLRKRKEDIPLLVDYFRREYCDSHPNKPAAFPQNMIREFCKNDWPGNIRELRNVVRRHCVMGPGCAQQTTDRERAPSFSQPIVFEHTCPPWKEFMEQQEKHYLETVLHAAAGKVTTACKAMGISRKSLYDKINKHAINLEEVRKKPQ